MSLVRSNKAKSLNRGPNIVPKETFSLDNIVQPKNNSYTPKPTTLKIDTKIRDQINTLSLIGYADTQREVVEKALESILENMDIDERRKFDIQYQVLEDKTIKSMKNK